MRGAWKDIFVHWVAAALSLGLALTLSPATAAPGGPRGRTDLMDTALRASGYMSASARRRARASLERHVGPIVNDLRRVPEPGRQAALLLQALHQKGGLLGRYDTRATTLRDILERRAYNCVSASVLYNLLAHRLSLPVAAQLLPTHARSLLSLERDGRLVSVVVETTSPHGFDPDPEQQATILASVTPVSDQAGRSLVSEQGAIVDTSVLIGTIFVNRASVAQEAGQLERAARLFEMGQRLAPEPSMQRVLIDQRAALMSQLAADDMTVGGQRRFERAWKSLKAAVRLSPSNPEIAQAIQQNIRALGDRWIARNVEREDARGVMRVMRRLSRLMSDADERGALRASAYNQVAAIAVNRGDFDAAIRFVEQALTEPLGSDRDELRLMLQRNLVAALRTGVLTRANEGRYDECKRYLSRLDAMDLDPKARQSVRKDHLRTVHVVGDLRLKAGDNAAAASVYREGLARFPNDETCRNNLMVALERLAMAQVNRGACRQAAPYLEEIRRTDARSAFPKQAKLRCVLTQARTRLTAGDHAEAVRLIRSVDVEHPTVRQNLSVALLRWTAALARVGRCRQARARADEVRAVANDQEAAITASLGRCR
ncbi:MAG: hypothetical protein AAFV29_02420 [Myxococcota bacterium]